MSYSPEVSQPTADIWHIIASCLDDKSLIALSVCSSVFNALVQDSLLRPFCLREVATYSSLDDAVERLMHVRWPLCMYRWSLFLEKHSEIGIEELAALGNSHSVHHLTLFLYYARQKACDYDILTKLALSLECGTYSLARYLLDLHDWSDKGVEIGRLLVRRKLYGLLAFCYAKGFIPSRTKLDTYRPVKEEFLWGWSYKYTIVPLGYEGGFYLASKCILWDTVYQSIFLTSMAYPLLKDRVYFQRSLATKLVTHSIYRYRLHFTGKIITSMNGRMITTVIEQDPTVIYFDSLDIVRGLQFFCLLMRISYDDYISGVYENGKDHAINVSINMVYDSRTEKQIVTVE